MRRLSRQANRLAWKPYRTQPRETPEEIGPRGEVWEVDEVGTPIERIYENGVDNPPDEQ